jgi:PAS domain S-box-containing protein
MKIKVPVNTDFTMQSYDVVDNEINKTESNIDNSSQFDKERQSIILQSIGDAVIATDLNGNVVLMNPIAEKLTGWQSEDAENKPIAEVFHLVHIETREEFDNPVETVLKTGKALKLAPNALLISRNKQSEYPINDSCAPIIDSKGDIMGVVLVFRDATKQKQAEMYKEKITANLVQRNKDHEHFANIISHDLRAPVANIISLTNMVNDKDLKESEKEFFMNSLTTSAERLDEVITDLNVILSLRAQLNQKRELVYFSKLVNDIQESIANILELQHAHFELDFSEIDEMLTIKSHLYSIFYNLISNSLKYRRPDIPLCITIKSNLVNDKITLSFKDNGLGVDLKKNGVDLFGMYKRFHTDKIEGKGIGLYMVKLQVEKLGGTISIKSEVNKGAEFTIDFSL